MKTNKKYPPEITYALKAILFFVKKLSLATPAAHETEWQPYIDECTRAIAILDGHTITRNGKIK